MCLPLVPRILSVARFDDLLVVPLHLPEEPIPQIRDGGWGHTQTRRCFWRAPPAMQHPTDAALFDLVAKVRVAEDDALDLEDVHLPEQFPDSVSWIESIHKLWDGPAQLGSEGVDASSHGLLTVTEGGGHLARLHPRLRLPQSRYPAVVAGDERRP